MKAYVGDQQKIFLNTSLRTLDRVAFVDAMPSIIGANIDHKDSFVHKVCKEYFWTDFLVMFYPKNFYLLETIDNKLNCFLSSGIMSHIIDEYVDLRHWHVKTTNRGPRQLSLEHLRGAFDLWLLFMLVAVTVFSLEIVTKRFKVERASKRRLIFKEKRLDA